MTERAARRVANVVLLSAGAAAAYVVFTTPPLRKLAAVASRRWLGVSLPMFLLTQARNAWVEAGQRQPGDKPGRRLAAESIPGDAQGGRLENRPLT